MENVKEEAGREDARQLRHDVPVETGRQFIRPARLESQS